MTRELATELCKRLAMEGFTVHRYDAKRTKSTYVKLDWGASGSIRISDHAGPLNSRYRHNIGPWIAKRRTVREGYPRKYWPVEDLDAMVADIIADREMRLDLYGEDAYKAHVEKLRKQVKRDRKHSGFWNGARLVRKPRKEGR